MCRRRGCGWLNTQSIPEPRPQRDRQKIRKRDMALGPLHALRFASSEQYSPNTASLWAAAAMSYRSVTSTNPRSQLRRILPALQL